jgi:hypothetical protein
MRHGGAAPKRAAEEQPPEQHVESARPGKCAPLIELARLCLLRASAASTPAVADELRRMAKEYQARADALTGEQMPDIAKAFGPSTPEAPSSSVQQQQQPQEGSGSPYARPSPSPPKRP